MRQVSRFVLILTLIGCTTLFAADLFSTQMLKRIQKENGAGAYQRILKWRDLIARIESLPEPEKLKQTNLFFNQIPYAEDQEVYGVPDYWATPIEFLVHNRGDCEEYALAKYYTLRLANVADEKLRMMYVKATQQNTAHMVLLYYPSPNDEPLVLDNLIEAIKLASDRKDLVPVYSFNAEGLWLAKSRGQNVRIGNSSALEFWRHFAEKMNLPLH